MREGGREGVSEGRREGAREGGMEGGREGTREGISRTFRSQGGPYKRAMKKMVSTHKAQTYRAHDDQGAR